MTNKSNPRLFLDIHVVQTVPPANINRDDTGSPKTAQYGGVTRARVSSQCWKGAIRKYFRDNGDIYVGIRSKYILDIILECIANKIREKDNSIDDDSAKKLAEGKKELVVKALTIANILKEKDKKDKKAKKGKKAQEAQEAQEAQDDKKLEALFFVTYKQLDNFAQACLDTNLDEKNLDKKEKSRIKEKLQNILKSDPTIDIALFGRMLAHDPSLNVDASAQVAHAISTHAVESEFDFYTAVDDWAPKDNAGASMLGTIEYNAATLYRYANVALHEFYKQLKNDKEETAKAVKLFVKAFVNSMPTGKINSFANQTLPQAIIVSLRTDRPINLVSAFEEPVKSENGYVDKSIQKLFEEYTRCEKILEQPLFTDYLLLTDKVEVAPIGKSTTNLSELLSDLEKAITENLTDGD